MKSKIFYEGTIDSAHFVPGSNSKCENIHGHTWKVQIDIVGEIQEDGMILDFGKIKEILDRLDHNTNNLGPYTPEYIRHPESTHIKGWFVRYIMNDIIPKPTAENMSIYIHDQIMKYEQIEFCNVRIYEGLNKGAEYNTALQS